MTHAEAREIIRQAWRMVHGRAPTEAELTYAQAIALLETGYGRTGQFAAMAARGQYNWGALQRRPGPGGCPPNTAPGNDQGSVCFYVYNTDVEAAAAYLRVLTKRHWPVVQAMRGSPEDVARAMRVPPPYYTGVSGGEQDRINAYANAIRNGIRRSGSAAPVPTSGSGSALPIVLALGAIGAYWWYRRSSDPASGRLQGAYG